MCCVRHMTAVKRGIKLDRLIRGVLSALSAHVLVLCTKYSVPRTDTYRGKTTPVERTATVQVVRVEPHLMPAQFWSLSVA